MSSKTPALIVKEDYEQLKGFLQPYQKVGSTEMMRIEGPFKCLTQGGEAYCEDGWVAFDSEGYPYPVATTVHEETYKPAAKPTELSCLVKNKLLELHTLLEGVGL